jgi:hypothetical protein
MEWFEVGLGFLRQDPTALEQATAFLMKTPPVHGPTGESGG